MTKTPLVAVLQTKALVTIQEVELPLEHFPDMIERWDNGDASEGLRLKQYFRIGITERRAAAFS